jgi:hypothetical protein
MHGGIQSCGRYAKTKEILKKKVVFFWKKSKMQKAVSG